MTLRNMTNKPIFVSIANNHSLDYGTKGIDNTRVESRNLSRKERSGFRNSNS